MGDIDHAIADYGEATHLNPRYAGAFYSRGVAFGSKQDYDRAVGDFSEAIKLNPQLAAAFRDRCLAWKLKGNPDRGPRRRRL